MILSLAELLGLPQGLPAPVLDPVTLRWALLLLGLLWGVLALRGRGVAALALGLLYAALACGIWALALGRPYGVLLDPEATRRAADIAVAAASGDRSTGFLVGQPATRGPWMALLGAGVPAPVVQLLPTLAPTLSLVATGLVLALLLAPRRTALTSACLWLAFSTGDLGAARGLGFVSAAWRHPEAALVWPAALLAALLLGRAPLSTRARTALVAALVLAAGLWRGGHASSLPEAVLALLLDPWLFLPLAWLGLRRECEPATLGLLLGGAASAIAQPLTGAGDGWAGLCAWRLGLILASVPALEEGARLALERAGEWRGLRLGSVAPDRLALGASLLLALPGGFLAWWDPVRTDATARASVESTAGATDETTAWIRQNTPADAVFVAGRAYAPLVAVMGQRRVLRAPDLLQPGDEGRRLRLEGALVLGRNPPAWAEDYHPSFLLAAPGDFAERGIRGPEDLEQRSGLLRRYSGAHGFGVFEIVR
jgi:hypothetical protein